MLIKDLLVCGLVLLRKYCDLCPFHAIWSCVPFYNIILVLWGEFSWYLWSTHCIVHLFLIYFIVHLFKIPRIWHTGHLYSLVFPFKVKIWSVTDLLYLHRAWYSHIRLFCIFIHSLSYTLCQYCPVLRYFYNFQSSVLKYRTYFGFNPNLW